jgi:hypothetical protein
MAKRKSNREARRLLGLPFHESNRRWKTALGFSSINTCYTSHKKSMSRSQRRAAKEVAAYLAERAAQEQTS